MDLFEEAKQIGMQVFGRKPNYIRYNTRQTVLVFWLFSCDELQTRRHYIGEIQESIKQKVKEIQECINKLKTTNMLVTYKSALEHQCGLIYLRIITSAGEQLQNSPQYKKVLSKFQKVFRLTPHSVNWTKFGAVVKFLQTDPRSPSDVQKWDERANRVVTSLKKELDSKQIELRTFTVYKPIIVFLPYI